MRTINKFDQLTGLSKRVTLINVVETDKKGNTYPSEMPLRNALQAMRVQPERFKLADGEKFPKGVSVNMVPLGTTMEDVRNFEKTRGTVGKVQKTTLDNVLDAIERGVELQETEVIDSDSSAIAGAMMSDEAPPDYKPTGVDLTPADSMKDNAITDEEKALEKSAEEEPALNEIKEKELSFEKETNAPVGYTKQQIKDLSKDKLQAILVGLPAYKTMAKKMQATILKAKKDPLIDTIVQLSKKK